MILVRPATLDDLDALHQLAQSAGTGLTTLPDDRELLRKRIAKSVRSMENIPDRPGGESYLLVMEDLAKNRVIGASGIVSKVGGFEPFYAYRVEIQSFDCAPLNVHKKIRVLHLVRDHDGPAEVGSLFLSPDYRKKDHGRFLQLVRFLFVAEHPDAFEPLVVSELRGVIDDSGRSAFWDAVGRHFFEIDFPKADHLSVVNKKFIADLMPTYPIYVPLLPDKAQTVIGQVHESSKPALKNLEGEGFRFNGMVDIFDAGPCVSCQRDEIRTVRQSRVATVEKIGDEATDLPVCMICPSGGPFVACMGSVQSLSAQSIQLSERAASALKIALGATVRFAPLKPPSAAMDRRETAPRDGEDLP
jgi:arginine N-succinyltransferase